MQVLRVHTAHMGEFGYRRVIFDITSGDVWVRFNALRNVPGDMRTLNGRK